MADRLANYNDIASRLSAASPDKLPRIKNTDSEIGMLTSTIGYIKVMVEYDDGTRTVGNARFEFGLQGKSAQATAPIEDAETSALGRALMQRGYATDKRLASDEEIERAKERSEMTQQPAAQRKPQAHSVQSKGAVIPKATTQPQPEQAFSRSNAVKAIEALPKYDKALHGERLAAANDRDAMAVLYHEIVGL